ncbi:MAG: TIGR00730 family Rossman fold protein [Candidatus Nanopelagicales bacterium]
MASICVFCASSTRIDSRYLDLATAVGTEIAARGHDLVTGGGSVSCMGAVARAVRAGGRSTVGVIPRALVDREVADHDATELLVTGDMRERKGVMDARSEAFLTLPGGIGTLEELLEVWVARTLGMHAKPVVVLDPWDTYAPLRAQVEALVREEFVRPEARELLVWTSTVEEALDAVEAGLAIPPAPAQPAAEELLEAEP